MSKKYLAMLLHKNPQTKPSVLLTLPSGCIGIMFVFKTKKAARGFSGNHVLLSEVSEVKELK